MLAYKTWKDKAAMRPVCLRLIRFLSKPTLSLKHKISLRSTIKYPFKRRDSRKVIVNGFPGPTKAISSNFPRRSSLIHWRVWSVTLMEWLKSHGFWCGWDDFHRWLVFSKWICTMSITISIPPWGVPDVDRGAGGWQRCIRSLGQGS